ncbi:Uncharacterised protein g1589 [Pycnogonum litorale]
MRQLKGNVKETRKEKRARKLENVKNKEQFFKIALPVFCALVGFIVLYIYSNTRPAIK